MDFSKVTILLLIFNYNPILFSESEGFCEDIPKLERQCLKVCIDYALKTIESGVEELLLSSSPQKELTVLLRDYVPFLRKLQLSGGNLTRISNTSFIGLHNLTQITLVNNQLFRLEENTFCHLNNLQNIYLGSNKFTALSDLIPAIKCANLDKLDLSRNVLLQSITSNEVEQIQDIRVNELDLTNCAIRRIDDNALTALNNVRKLLLSGNPLDYKGLRNVSHGLSKTSVRTLIARRLSNNTFIKSDVLMPLSNSTLELLDIGENVLNVVPHLLHLTKLKRLVIDRCGLIEFYGLQIFGIPNLQILNANKNQLKRIIVNESDIGYKLRELDLSDNGVTLKWNFVLPSDIFTVLPNLEILDLSRTTFGTTLTGEQFLGNNNLKTVRFRKCSIVTIEDYAFKNLTLLDMLALDGNKISVLRSEIFYGLSSLTNLNLAENSIYTLRNPDLFIHLVSLTILILSYNDIVNLEPVFKPLKSLEVLLLNHNRILSWENRILTENKNMSYLRINYNNITYVTPAMLEDFSSVKGELNFSDNNFDCTNCSIITLQNWNRDFNIVTEDYYKYYKCIIPPFQNVFEYESSHCIFIEEKPILLVSLISCGTLLIILTILISFKYKWHIRYFWNILSSRVERYRECHDSASYTYDAFVSYDSLNCDWIVNQLLPTLETDEMHFCLHDRDCPAGNDVTEEVLEYVQKCRKIMLVISESYIKNQWCMFELQMAQHRLFEERRDSLILIHLGSIQELQLPSNLKYLMNTRTYIPWTDHPMGQKLFWKRLRKALNKPDTLKLNRIV